MRDLLCKNSGEKSRNSPQQLHGIRAGVGDWLWPAVNRPLVVEFQARSGEGRALGEGARSWRRRSNRRETRPSGGGQQRECVCCR